MNILLGVLFDYKNIPTKLKQKKILEENYVFINTC